MPSGAWSPDFTPPDPPSSERLFLEVLSPAVVELDYRAIMDSRARLREELQWGGERPWPADDFSLEENHQDLADHQAEFLRREAYAYTVLDPARETCLGCVYLRPWHQDAKLYFWVIDRELETNLEAHLLETVLTWLDTAWPFTRVVLPFRASNARGIDLARQLELSPLASADFPDHICFAWTRDTSGVPDRA